MARPHTRCGPHLVGGVRRTVARARATYTRSLPVAHQHPDDRFGPFTEAPTPSAFPLASTATPASHSRGARHREPGGRPHRAHRSAIPAAHQRHHVVGPCARGSARNRPRLRNQLTGHVAVAGTDMPAQRDDSSAVTDSRCDTSLSVAASTTASTPAGTSARMRSTASSPRLTITSAPRARTRSTSAQPQPLCAALPLPCRTLTGAAQGAFLRLN